VPISPRGPGHGAVPAHVAWVARRAPRGPGAGDREAAALLALVDAALGRGVGWLTLQVPSGGQALRARAAELAERAIALWTGSPGGGPPVPVLEPSRLAGAGRPALQVLLAAEGSGRRELVGAVRELAGQGVRPEDLDDARMAGALGVPDVDLLVLSDGDRRVPDLLVWQMAYSEIVVLDAPWPDVGAAHFDEALAEYQGRERRYGGIVAAR